eukprot:TRINITY_DN41160_c0_g1_i1.p1 TRINITY_DN41160_c0_g1~~TRINITY_DN41160_c0_g1_i1.p1  ORF type:complete len:478 (-),score=109.07 TRINITY_DN41160_c0_g1_i1:50-1483(-)
MVSHCTDDSFDCAPWAECLSETFPCSHSVLGNLVLILFYGFIISKGATFIADGSELLMEILDPGLIGGFLLPVLGAVPDAAIIVVSCLGPIETVKDQIAVGVGTLAGSTIMLLTLPFAGSLISGRCDLEKNHEGKLKAVDGKLTHGKSLTKTGGSVFSDVPVNARIMMLTTLPYFIIQIRTFFVKSFDESEDKQVHDEKDYAFIAFIIGAVSFCLYSIYQVMSAHSKDVQKRRFEEVRQRHLTAKAVSAFSASMRRNVSVQSAENAPLLNEPTAINRGSSAHSLALKWKMKTQANRIEDQGAAEDEAMNEESHQSKGAIARKSALYLFIGTLIVVVFSDPMVDAISGWGKAAGINAFYVSFIVTPLASNASEILASLSFASKKKTRNLSMSFSALFGAATLNNTLCLSIFLFFIYNRGLTWTFSAETAAILLVIFLSFLVGCNKTTYKHIWAYFLIMLFPLSLGLVYFLESDQIGWD